MLYATRLSCDAAMVKGLEAHSLDVLRAALAMFVDRSVLPNRIGVAWMRFFRIAPERWPVFRLNLIACALLHDIGKATEGHQLAMQRGRVGQLLLVKGSATARTASWRCSAAAWDSCCAMSM